MTREDININQSLLAEGFEKCKAITKKYGTSYFFATQFFPKDVRKAIYAIYAFARIPDQIVDDPDKKDKKETLEKLEQWRTDWLRAMAKGSSKDPILSAIIYIFYEYEIPLEDGEAFLKSMFLDEEKFEYQTYAELEEYMYGSAGVIGLMVTRIVGYSSQDAFQYAIKLGYAFQMTNFLRDIREDSEDLGRVYLPIDELKQFKLEKKDILDQTTDERFVDFMKFQILRTKEIYRSSLPGIRLLNWRGRLAVRISYVLYRAILTEIERENYKIYSKRVRTNFRQKIFLSFKALFGFYE